MKRLIPATIMLALSILLCFYSHLQINRQCNETLQDLIAFSNGQITAHTVRENWHSRKGKMSFFVNHEFLDDITLYTGQLSTSFDQTDAVLCKSIETTLSMIKEEQRLSLHSLY